MKRKLQSKTTKTLRNFLVVILIAATLVTSVFAAWQYSTENRWTLSAGFLNNLVCTNQSASDLNYHSTGGSSVVGWAALYQGDIFAYRIQEPYALGVRAYLINNVSGEVYANTALTYNTESTSGYGASSAKYQCLPGTWYASAETKVLFDGSYDTKWTYMSPTITVT